MQSYLDGGHLQRVHDMESNPRFFSCYQIFRGFRDCEGLAGILWSLPRVMNSKPVLGVVEDDFGFPSPDCMVRH